MTTAPAPAWYEKGKAELDTAREGGPVADAIRAAKIGLLAGCTRGTTYCARAFVAGRLKRSTA